MASIVKDKFKAGLGRKLFTGFWVTEVLLYALVVVVFFTLINNTLKVFFDAIKIYNVSVPIMIVTLAFAVMLILRVVITFIEKQSVRWTDLMIPMAAITVFVLIVWLVFPYFAPDSYTFSIMSLRTSAMSIIGMP
jgi:hypothetical protein